MTAADALAARIEEAADVLAKLTDDATEVGVVAGQEEPEWFGSAVRRLDEAEQLARGVARDIRLSGSRVFSEWVPVDQDDDQ